VGGRDWKGAALETIPENGVSFKDQEDLHRIERLESEIPFSKQHIMGKNK